MKNVNDILTVKYYQILAPACLPVPVYRDGYIPNDLLSDAYVMISSVANADGSSMNSHDTTTLIQVSIYTRSSIENNADILNSTADKIFAAVMPGYLSAPFADTAGISVATTELSGDTTPAPLLAGSDIYLNRFITFRHIINHL